MDSFIKTNDRLVNLQNVSNINIVHDTQRVVFNMNYSIEIEKHNNTKMISDYVYLDTRNSKDFENALIELYDNQYIKDNFLSHDTGYINIHEISSVKFSEQKNRVIFNLSHNKDFKDYRSGNTLLTSEFVYVDFSSYKDYKEFAIQTKNELMEK